MRKPVNRTIQLQYYPNPAAKQQAVKALVIAVDSVRSGSNTKTIRRINNEQKSA